MTPTEVLEAIGRALQDTGQFTGGSYINHLADWEHGDAGLKQPVVVIQPVGRIRSDAHDSDLVGYTTDANGDRTGRIFQADWEMEVQLDIYVAGGNPNLDEKQLGHDLETALLPFDSKRQLSKFPDGDGGVVDAITHFRVGEGRPEPDTGGEMTARRWRQDLMVHFHDQATTTDDQITTVATANSDEMETGDSDDELVWNY